MRTIGVLVAALCSPAVVSAQDALKAALAKKIAFEDVARASQFLPLGEAMKGLSQRTGIDLAIDPRLKDADVLDRKVPVVAVNVKEISAGTAYELVARSIGCRTAVRQGKLVLEPTVRDLGGGVFEPLPRPKRTAEEAAAGKKMRDRVEAAKVIHSAPVQAPFGEALGQLAKCHEPRIPVAVDLTAFKARGPGRRGDTPLLDRPVKLEKQDQATATKALTSLASQVGGELEYLPDLVLIVPAAKKR